jgi:COP9 signalosome complex subunit 6
VTADDLALHLQMTSFNEAPLFLQLSPSATLDASSKVLPLVAYQAEYHGAALAFTRLGYKVETSESERVTADHVLNVAAQRGAGDESSCTSVLPSYEFWSDWLPPPPPLSPPPLPPPPHHHHASPAAVSLQLQVSAAAVRGLAERLDTLAAYVAAVRAGSAAPNHSLLREISAVVGRVPVTDAPAFQRDLTSDVGDSLLLAYAASLTKGAAALGSLTSKLRVTAAEKEREARAAAGQSAVLGGMGGVGGMMGLGGMGLGGMGGSGIGGVGAGGRRGYGGNRMHH